MLTFLLLILIIAFSHLISISSIYPPLGELLPITIFEFEVDRKLGNEENCTRLKKEDWKPRIEGFVETQNPRSPPKFKGSFDVITMMKKAGKTLQILASFDRTCYMNPIVTGLLFRQWPPAGKQAGLIHHPRTQSFQNTTLNAPVQKASMMLQLLPLENKGLI